MPPIAAPAPVPASPPTRPHSRTFRRWGYGLVTLGIFGTGFLTLLWPRPLIVGHPPQQDTLGQYLHQACTQKDSTLQPALNRVLEAWLTAAEAEAQAAPPARDHDPAQPQAHTPTPAQTLPETRPPQAPKRTARQGDGRELLRLIWTARIQQDQNNPERTEYFAFPHEIQFIHPAPGNPLKPPLDEGDMALRLKASYSQKDASPQPPVTALLAASAAWGYADSRQQWYRFEAARPRWWETDTSLILRVWSTGPNQRDENGEGDDRQTRIRLRPDSDYRYQPPNTSVWHLKTMPPDAPPLPQAP